MVYDYPSTYLTSGKDKDILTIEKGESKITAVIKNYSIIHLTVKAENNQELSSLKMRVLRRKIDDLIVLMEKLSI